MLPATMFSSLFQGMTLLTADLFLVCGHMKMQMSWQRENAIFGDLPSPACSLTVGEARFEVPPLPVFVKCPHFCGC